MTKQYTTRTTCRVCGGKNLTPLFSLGEQFVSDFVDRSDVKTGNVVPIDVDRCRDCTLVQARHAAPAEILYKGTYWYRSGVTQTMRDALRDVTRAVEERVPLENGDLVLDIGSNDGTLLRSYQNRKLTTVGVEPAKNLVEEGRKGISYLINDLWAYDSLLSVFGPSGRPEFKAITAIGMFYDMEDPNPFVRDVALALAPDGLFVAQLMCVKQTLAKRDVGNFAHEHLEFYTLRSLEALFGAYGLVIDDLQENDVNGGSYRLFVRHRSRVPATTITPETYRVQSAMLAEHEAGLYTDDPYHRFFADTNRNRGMLQQFITQEKLAGKRFWVYGASTKGNVILQHAGLDATVIDGAADRDPNKWGKFTVGTGIPITSEEQFRAAQPDYAIVMPYAFLPEFLTRESEWRSRGGKFVVPIPEFKIV